MNSDVKLIFRSSLKTQDHNTCIVCFRAGLIEAKCHGQKDVIKPIFSHLQCRVFIVMTVLVSQLFCFAITWNRLTSRHAVASQSCSALIISCGSCLFVLELRSDVESILTTHLTQDRLYSIKKAVVARLRFSLLSWIDPAFDRNDILL